MLMMIIVAQQLHTKVRVAFMMFSDLAMNGRVLVIELHLLFGLDYLHFSLVDLDLRLEIMFDEFFIALELTHIHRFKKVFDYFPFLVGISIANFLLERYFSHFLDRILFPENMLIDSGLFVQFFHDLLGDGEEDQGFVGVIVEHE